VGNEASQRSAVPSVARSAPTDEQRGIASSEKEVDVDTEQLQEPKSDSMQLYTSIYRLEPGRSPGNDLLLLLVFQATCSLSLCSSGPVAYDLTSKEVVDDFGHDGRRDRNSRTALGNVSYRFFCVIVKRYRGRKGLPAEDACAPDEGLERKAGRCAQSQQIVVDAIEVVVRLFKLLRRQVDEK